MEDTSNSRELPPPLRPVETADSYVDVDAEVGEIEDVSSTGMVNYIVDVNKKVSVQRLNALAPPLKTLEFARLAQKQLDAAWKKYLKKLGSDDKDDLLLMSSRELAQQMLDLHEPMDPEVNAQITANLHSALDEGLLDWNGVKFGKEQPTENTPVAGAAAVDTFLDDEPSGPSAAGSSALPLPVPPSTPGAPGVPGVPGVPGAPGVSDIDYSDPFKDLGGH